MMEFLVSRSIQRQTGFPTLGILFSIHNHREMKTNKTSINSKSCEEEGKEGEGQSHKRRLEIRKIK